MRILPRCSVCCPTWVYEFTVNPRLVRGLDYYSHTVFEWISTDLGSQGTVCGGGRYDGLFEILGVKRHLRWVLAWVWSACLLTQDVLSKEADVGCDVYVCIKVRRRSEWLAWLGICVKSAWMWCCTARARTDWGVSNPDEKSGCGAGQLRLIIGEDEVNNGTLTIKHLRGDANNLTRRSRYHRRMRRSGYYGRLRVRLTNKFNIIRYLISNSSIKGN